MGVIIHLTTIDQKIHKIQDQDSDLTCLQFKQFIYDELCHQLEPSMMRLQIDNVKVQDDQLFIQEFQKQHRKQIAASYYYSIQKSILQIVQKKAALDQVQGIKVDMDYECPVSCEKGAAIMECGHKAGPQFMLGLLNTTINSGQYQVKCPHKVILSICNRVWDPQKCRKVSILTESQFNQISTGLSNNWIDKHCKSCPKCKHKIMKVGIDHNRVKCDHCKYGDFCFLCLDIWKTSNMKVCGNQACEEYTKTLKDAAMSREFEVKKKGTNQVMKVSTPQFRACPVCQSIVQNYTACKHTECIKCKKKFCWICLSLFQNDVWKCGSYNEFCGAVAPKQYS